VQRRYSALIPLVGFLAAIGVGYWISSVIGTEALRKEAEKQLAFIMEGRVEIGTAGLAMDGGLFIQGESVGVYPDTVSNGGPRLFARRVVAQIDLLALATGRFRLSGLLLEDVTLDIRRDSSGGWHPFPVQALAGVGAENQSADDEAYLDVFTAFEGVTRTLLAKPIAADRVEIRRGRILFVDDMNKAGLGEESSVIVSLDHLDGLLIHHWLSGEATLQIAGILRSGEINPTPVEIAGENTGADEYRLRISAGGLDLGILHPYFAGDGGIAWPEGSLTGSVEYRTSSPETGLLALDWTVDSFRTQYSLESGSLAFSEERLRLAAVGRANPGAFRLTGTMVVSSGLEVGLDCEAERPLLASSSMELAAEIRGADSNWLRKLSKALVPGGEGTLSGLESGRAEKLGIAGTMSLSDWGRLSSGELSPLPQGITIVAELADITISGKPEETFTKLEGRIELRGDTFLLRHGRGERNGEPLPAMNARISGFSNFLRAETTRAEPDAIAPDFPGLGPLIELLEEAAPDENESESAAVDRGEDAEDPLLEAEEERAPVAWDVRIDHLEHPSLPWVIRNADFSIVRSSRSTKIAIASMLWGGVPSRGTMTWTTSPNSRIQLVLRAGPPTPGDEEEAGIATPVPNPSPAGEAAKPVERLPWLSGRVKIPWLDTGLIPLEGLTTNFAVQGNSLYLTGFQAGLEAGGKLTGDMEVRLGRPDAVPVALVFSIEDASLSRIAEIFGVPAGEITGTLRLGGALAGDLHPGQPLLADLEGRVDMGARQGELRRQTLPILLALAQASEGYNDYAERTSIAYESMTADMTLADDHISTQNFELEGPLRIYASGTLDVAHPPYEIIGVAGLFLFRGAGQLLEAIPLVKIILPGSEKGLVGTYYQVSGHLGEPTVRTLPGRSFAEGLPDALEAPYQILRAILSGGQIDDGQTGQPPSP